MFENTNTLDRINKQIRHCRRKISVLEDIAIETILNESQRDKKTLKQFFKKSNSEQWKYFKQHNHR